MHLSVPHRESMPRARYRRAAAAALLAAAIAAGGCTDRPRLVERRLYSMGTWVDVALEAPARTAEAALADVEAMLRRFEIDYYPWAEGELARLNEALAAGRETVVSEEMAAVLRDAKRYSELSGGRFDPGVAKLVELWGFNSTLAHPSAPPGPAAIEAWLGSGSSIAALEIQGRRIRAKAKVMLDLGGIAKGAAVDRIIEMFRSRGIRNALVNAGGDLRVLGSRGGRPWRVGIQHPRADDVLGIIELGDGEAAFTSGDYERYVERDGRRFHHILDPRTGYPADETQSVTVVAAQGVLADAAATALFVAGDDWRSVARALGIDAALRVDADGHVELTDAMRRRLVSDDPEHVGSGS
ncbi:MAG TPA: FAD:protein FMN transferase [Gammaproteobacteria bacterium]